MIGKISKGTGFKGCVNYVLGKPDARLLTAEGVLTDSIQTITDCFQTQRMMKPNIRQPVGHISLSYAPEDTPRMTDETLVSLAKEYMQKMGIRDTQYIIARHNDQKHPHVHIVFNRVDNNGRTISDRNDCYRNIKVCKELKEKYGLYFGKGKDRVRTHRLKGSDKTKYEIYHAVKNSLGKSNSWKQFISELSKQGIKTEFKYRGRSNVIQGLSFTKDGITFKASEIDRSFRYLKPDLRSIREIYAIGLPAIISQALLTVMTYGLNIILGQLPEVGENTVTVYGLYCKIQQMIIFAAVGVRDAITPIVSFNFGMRNKKRIMDGIRYGMIFTAVLMVIGLVVIELGADVLTRFFSLSDVTYAMCAVLMYIRAKRKKINVCVGGNEHGICNIK